MLFPPVAVVVALYQLFCHQLQIFEASYPQAVRQTFFCQHQKILTDRTNP